MSLAFSYKLDITGKYDERLVVRRSNKQNLILLEHGCRFLMLVSLLVMTLCWAYKDRLPRPHFYHSLAEPQQTPLNKPPFFITTNQQKYKITPRYRYILQGVVVTYNDADQFGNIWHHKRWKDFINLRDICVVWGNNVTNGVYRAVDFYSDSWTCWVRWQDPGINDRFSMTQLSNNHLLTINSQIKQALLSTEVGDQIRFEGMLVDYKNIHHGGSRKSSTRRDDVGNGACETVYLTKFEIIKKANPGYRTWYRSSKYAAIVSGVCWLLLLTMTPPRGTRRAR